MVHVEVKVMLIMQVHVCSNNVDIHCYNDLHCCHDLVVVTT
jgi:hypothetical protein